MIHIRDITFGIIFSPLFEKPFYHVRYTSATDKREYFLQQARELKILTGITVDIAPPCFPEIYPVLLVLHKGDPCTLSPDKAWSRESALNSRLTATTIAKVFTKGREALRSQETDVDFWREKPHKTSHSGIPRLPAGGGRITQHAHIHLCS